MVYAGNSVDTTNQIIWSTPENVYIYTYVCVCMYVCLGRKDQDKSLLGFD